MSVSRIEHIEGMPSASVAHPQLIDSPHPTAFSLQVEESWP